MDGSVKAQIIASGNQASWVEKISTLVNDRPWEACAHIIILTVCAIVLWRTPLYEKSVNEEDLKKIPTPLKAEETKPKGKFYADEGILRALCQYLTQILISSKQMT
jgi:hypothetical protein